MFRGHRLRIGIWRRINILRYNMNNLVIPARNIEVDYPSTWDEIGEKHAARIGEILHLAYTGKIDYDMARKLAVDEFLNRVNSPAKPTDGEKSWNYWANEGILAGSVDFLFEQTERRVSNPSVQPVNAVSKNPTFCTQLSPRIKVGWRTYIGPKDLLADVTIFEFKEASWRIGKYAETLDDRYLDELFGVLYKRRRGEGEKVRMGEKAMRRLGERAKRIPIGVKFMVYLFFLGCMNWMREESIEIDGKEICFGCLFPTTPANATPPREGNHDNTGMAGILFQMAESGVFGNMEQTSKVSMWDVFLRLYQIHWQIKEMKEMKQ